jgi:hypothetical protein
MTRAWQDDSATCQALIQRFGGRLPYPIATRIGYQSQ